MAVITFTIPDPAVPRVLDAFADVYVWTTDTVMTKAEFARFQVIQFVKRTVVESEQGAVRAAATADLVTEVEALGVS